jgi:hypothetical protein
MCRGACRPPRCHRWPRWRDEVTLGSGALRSLTRNLLGAYSEPYSEPISNGITILGTSELFWERSRGVPEYELIYQREREPEPEGTGGHTPEHEPQEVPRFREPFVLLEKGSEETRVSVRGAGQRSRTVQTWRWFRYHHAQEASEERSNCAVNTMNHVVDDANAHE